MTTATRPSRFREIAMGNGSGDKPAQSLASSFGGTGWQPSGIWSSTLAFPKREAVTSKGSDENYSTGPSGSGALTATSEAEPWGSQARAPWNSSDANTQNRDGSGNTSPTRHRETSMHDVSNTSPSYFTSSQPTAIGARRDYIGSRSKPASGLDPSTNAFRYSAHFGDSEEKENGAALGPGKFEMDHERRPFRADRQGSQDPSYLSFGQASREPSMAPSARSAIDSRPPSQAFSDFFQGPPPNGIHHGHRPSIGAPSGSFPTAGANGRPYGRNSSQDIDDDLSGTLGKNLSFADGPNGLPGVLSGASAFNGGSHQAFQLNPGSQPWDSARQNGPAFASDVYAESLASRYPQSRGPFDRGSPAGSSYNARLASPKGFGGTPQPTMDPWQRPASRDPRFDGERRNSGQQYAAAPPSYFTPPQYYNQQYPPQFPPHLYDPYASAHQAFRAPVPLHGYGLPVNPYLAGTAGIPTRPSKDQDPAKGVRSLLLEEFRSSSKSNKRYELKDIYHHVVEFSGDQHGSRFIQQKLETANSDEKDQIFREIEPNAVQLMKDVFGNYVIQKFFEHGNQVQKKVLASVMKGKVVDLSTQMYACRVVQKALEHVLVEQQAELVREIEPEVLKVMKDQNGNHVIQKIIELVPRQYTNFVMDCFHGRVKELATHTYGCRVVQRVLEHGSEEDKAMVMAELHGAARDLIVDQYGNYVTQHVIQHGQPDDRSKMIRIVTSQLVTLSKHKFASNVVEKCIEHGSADDRREIRKQLTATAVDGSSPLQIMMKDQYGNYVIQKLMNQLDGPDRESFIEEMKPHIAALKKTCTGRQIAAIDRLVCAAFPASTKAGTPASTAPASPSLQVDISSAAPTPNLTNEPNSPQSSSPPSTNASAVDETVDEMIKGKLASNDTGASFPEVRVEEA